MKVPCEELNGDIRAECGGCGFGAACSPTSEIAEMRSGQPPSIYSLPSTDLVKTEAILTSISTRPIFPTSVSRARIADDALLADLVMAAQSLERTFKTLTSNASSGLEPNNHMFYAWQMLHYDRWPEEGLRRVLRPPLAAALERLTSVVRSACIEQVLMSERQQQPGFEEGLEDAFGSAERDAYRRHLQSVQVTLWSAIDRAPGDGLGHPAHLHGGYCSGVAYVRMPHGAPQLRLIDPRDARTRLKVFDGGRQSQQTAESQASDDVHVATTAWREARSRATCDQVDLLSCIPDVDARFKSDLAPHGPFSSKVAVAAQTGDVILFPPWLAHEVPPQWDDNAQNGDERIVFSFNMGDA